MMSADRLLWVLREAVTRKVLYLGLSFFAAFALLVCVDSFQHVAVDDFTDRVDNQKSRSLLGSAIVARLLMIELETKNIIDADNIRTAAILHAGVEQNLDDVAAILSVFQGGGDFINALPANFYEVGEVNERISYSKLESDGYVLEVIELTPKIMEIREALTQIAYEKVGLLESGRAGNGRGAEERIQIELMKVNALILRARESAGKIFYDTQNEIQRLSRLKEDTLYRFEVVRTVISLLTLAVCGFLLVRIVFRIRSILKDRKLKADDLEEAKSVIETIVDSTPVGLIIFDENKMIVRANTEALSLFEADTPAQIIGKHCGTLFALGADHECPLQNHVDQSHIVELPIKTLSGRTLTVLKKAIRISLSGKRYLLEAFMDISQRLEMEAELQEQRDYTNAMLQGVQAGVVVIDASDHTIVDMNESAARLMGVEREAAVGAVCHKYICPAEVGRCPVTDLGQNVDHAVRTLANGKSILKSVVPFRRGNTSYLLESFVDITDRVHAEEELKHALKAADQASRAKGEFLANMSHEIRTPLNAVIGLGHLLLSSKLDLEQRDYVEKMLASSEALLGVISDILDFSKIEAGQLSMESEPFLLEDVLAKLANIMSVMTEGKEVEVLFDKAADVPSVLVGDALRLSQVLTNLAGNAVKFTSRGEIVIKIRVLRRTDSDIAMRFSVRDTGIGLTSEHLGKLFQPFSQADGSVTRRFGGTGLGLTICKRLVDLMGGEITVESELGKGSTFAFTATFGRADEATLDVDLADPEKLRGMHVLIVDDNAMSRKILRSMAESFSFKAETVNSGEEALSAVEQAKADGKPYDLVIMDWLMPGGMDGIETTRRIRADSESAERTPVVLMVTAYKNEAMDSCSPGERPEEILVKPVTPSQLLESMLRAFSKDSNLDSKGVPDAPGAFPSFAGGSVLLVEDSEINRLIAEEILGKFGVSVQSAHNGLEGCEAARESSYDVILMDVQMPVMDGLEACRTLRREGIETPVVAMTAHAMKGDREECLEAGMNDYVTKPVNPGKLFSVLSQWLPTESEQSPEGGAGGDGVPEERRTEALPDLEAGPALEAMGGDEEFYNTMLLMFEEQYSEAGFRIQGALARGDEEEARELNHELKGVAASLGLARVFSLAEEMDNIFKKKHEGDMKGLAELLCEAVEAGLLAIKDVLPQ